MYAALSSCCGGSFEAFVLLIRTNEPLCRLSLLSIQHNLIVAVSFFKEFFVLLRLEQLWGAFRLREMKQIIVHVQQGATKDNLSPVFHR